MGESEPDYDQAGAADYLRYLSGRAKAAAVLRVRAAEAMSAVNGTEKALAAAAAMDDSGWEGDADIGPDAVDDLAELHAAAAHLRNAFRIAIGHERDIRDEITAAEKEAGQ